MVRRRRGKGRQQYWQLRLLTSLYVDAETATGHHSGVGSPATGALNNVRPDILRWPMPINRPSVSAITDRMTALRPRLFGSGW